MRIQTRYLKEGDAWDVSQQTELAQRLDPRRRRRIRHRSSNPQRTHRTRHTNRRRQGQKQRHRSMHVVRYKTLLVGRRRVAEYRRTESRCRRNCPWMTLSRCPWMPWTPWWVHRCADNYIRNMSRCSWMSRHPRFFYPWLSCPSSSCQASGIRVVCRCCYLRRRRRRRRR